MQIARIIAAGTLAAGLAAGAATAQDTRTVEAKEDWFDQEIRWSDGPTSYRAKWAVLVMEGRLAVCGVGTHLSSRVDESRRVMKNRGVFLGDTLLVGDLTFFARAPRRSALVGEEATCVLTDMAPGSVRSRLVSLRNMVPGRRY